MLLSSCANQQAPGGGPVDVVPPRIIATDPPNNTVNFRDDRIVMELDKYVDQRSFNESVFISPHVSNLEFDWSGRSVEISFGEPLRPFTTYVVNVGTDVVDLNNRNRMAHAFTLAFSTGPDVDHGGIEGRIFPLRPDDPLTGVMIFAYRLDGRDADTLNPEKVQPDFVTQTGDGGAFALTHIPFGSYRVLAVRDEYRNLVYDPEADQFAVPSGPIVITPEDTLRTDLFLAMSREDTTAPRLIRAESPERNHIALTFSESVVLDRAGGARAEVADTVTGRALGVRSFYQQTTPATTAMVVTDTQDSTVFYRVTVAGVRDSAGNAISSLASSIVVQGSGRRDTLAPRLAGISLTDSARSVDASPQIALTFSDAVVIAHPEEVVQLTDATGRAVRLTVRTLDPARLDVEPSLPLVPLSWYRLTVRLDSIRTWNGGRLQDSLRIVHFRTFDPDDRSSIDGKVLDRFRGDLPLRYMVRAMRVARNQRGEETVRTDSSGNFSFQNIPEGEYVLQAFLDANGNGIYDAGRPQPFRASERLSALTDTLRLRARWPLDGVLIRFPR